MSGEWKPGDVAVVSIVRRAGNDDPTEYRAFFAGRYGWYGVTGGEGCGGLTENEEEFSIHRRPLVVIDPEDREQVERLVRAYLDCGDGIAELSTEPWSLPGMRMRQSLREFANPTPPKPPEPTGLGAVVFADCGCARGRQRFVRDDTGSEFPEAPWKAHCGHHRWSDLTLRDADDILTEGLPK